MIFIVTLSLFVKICYIRLQIYELLHYQQNKSGEKEQLDHAGGVKIVVGKNKKVFDLNYTKLHVLVEECGNTEKTVSDLYYVDLGT